jgi:hypothetical protein
MTARTAGEMRAGSVGRRGKCRIDDGKEVVHCSGVSVSSLAGPRTHWR